MFAVDNSSMKSLRRIVTNLESATEKEQKDTLEKIIQLIHTRAPSNCEIMSHLKNNKINEYQLFGALQMESASSGGTSAASIAVAPGGLGAGFDPDGDWRSVYGKSKPKAKKPIVIRRKI